jgi:hypothetical protein
MVKQVLACGIYKLNKFLIKMCHKNMLKSIIASCLIGASFLNIQKAEN